MNFDSFTNTKASLPSRKSLQDRDLSPLLAVYDKVLLATPHQKKHRVSPAELLRLDKLRYVELPSTVASRRKTPTDGGYILKSELQELMSWKLARGVWRPMLPSLIARNEEASVRDVTTEGFALFHTSTSSTKVDNKQADGGKHASKAIDILCQLKGVGPATASLLLSVAFPAAVPFFSDEIYYFFMSGQPRDKLEKIKYNMAEFAFVLAAVQGARRPSELSKVNGDGPTKEVVDGKDTKADGTAHIIPRADDIERATYVIQKLQNPDVWEAAFGQKEGAGEGESEAIERIVEAKGGSTRTKKNGRRSFGQANGDDSNTMNETKSNGGPDMKEEEKVQTAELENAISSNKAAEDSEKTEKEKEQIRAVKKAAIVASGGTIRKVGRPRKSATTTATTATTKAAEVPTAGDRKRKSQFVDPPEGTRRSSRQAKRVEL